MLRGVKTGYIFPYSNVRNFPEHGYTVSSLCKARFYMNTSSLVITVGFVLPTLTSVNQKLEKHVNEGDDISMKELINIFIKSGKTNLIAFADRLTRVALETSLACALITCQNDFADSVVYVWDLHPRLHQYYFSELFRFMRIPRFLATLLGPSPSSADIAFVETAIPPFAAVEDVVKRKTISWVANVVVDLARIGLAGPMKDKKTAALKQVVLHTSTTLCCAVGAGVGRGVGGGRGEYWGEIVGLFCVPLINVGYMAKVVRRQLQRRGHTSFSGGHRHHHKHENSERLSSLDKPAVVE
ncbi:unnamed protein product [Phytomonas sp. Hart1]|nr:unnamed protein product [Phytomonas sp. Hart1]|eukprot:CCW71172.1 unnamed protein product [Phytomonas sp. isolate Hart1]